MPPAPNHPNESERLEVLNRYAILDTLPEENYDDLTFLASQICGTPISLISLVDKDRQWFKSRRGLEATETPRDVSFCAHAILQDDVFEVEDAPNDPRFAANDLVTGVTNIQFYAGAPLISPEGYQLGTICVMDQKPRRLSPEQNQALKVLARQVISQMELWRTVKRLQIADAGRQQALAQLAANATLLKQFVEHAPAAIAMFDRDMRYIAVSRRFLADYGLTGMDLPGKLHYDVFPNLPERWKEVHRRCLAGAVESCDMDEYTRVDGSHDFLRWEVRPWRRASGDIGGVIMLIELTTDRVRAERIKNEFLSVVSHELRTPLTSIRGALGLLSGGVAGELPPPAQNMVEIARKNSERLVLLINDILDIEKIESGKMRFDLTPVKVRSLLEAAVESNRGYAETLKVRLELLGNQESDGRLLVQGDETRLMQVLANLISNACKFSPPGEEVSIAYERIRFSPRNHQFCASVNGEAGGGHAGLGAAFGAANAQLGLIQTVADGQHLDPENDTLVLPGVRVLVMDRGPGVPPNFVGRLFEKFAQADATNTRQQSGTGLGLAIAGAIVEKHGGHIGYVEPEPGSQVTGATFFVELPLLDPQGDSLY